MSSSGKDRLQRPGAASARFASPRWWTWSLTVLVVMGVISLTAFVLLGDSLDDSSHHDEIRAEAGHASELVEHTVNTMRLLVTAERASEREIHRSHLMADTKDLIAQAQVLADARASVGPEAQPSQDLVTRLDNFATEVDRLARTANASTTVEDPAVAALLEQGGPLASELQALAGQSDSMASSATERARLLGFGLLAAVFTALAATGLFVIRPAAAAVEAEGQRLEDQNRALITQLAEEAAAARAHAHDLERSNADLEQFAYVASHDLQEPLRTVASYVQLLQARYEGELDEDADEFIAFTVSGVTRMQNLIRDLLAYSQASGPPPTMEPTNLDEVLDTVIEDVAATIAATDAEIERDPLPVVMGNRTQLIQLFQNLLSNALKFHGDKPPRIDIRASDHGDRWRITVADQGLGFDPAYREKAFQIFQRLHDPGLVAGTGVGLAVCKRIIENHGGEIDVETAPGKGATFRFTLPSAPPEASPSREDPARPLERLVDRSSELV